MSLGSYACHLWWQLKNMPMSALKNSLEYEIWIRIFMEMPQIYQLCCRGGKLPLFCHFVILPLDWNLRNPAAEIKKGRWILFIIVTYWYVITMPSFYIPLSNILFVSVITFKLSLCINFIPYVPNISLRHKASAFTVLLFWYFTGIYN